MVLLFFAAWFVAEVVAFVVVAEQIGLLLAIVAVLAVSACGPFLIRRAGLGVLAHARARLARGEPPERELLDGVVLLLGGALVCIPGFVGDAIGLALLVAPIRHLVIRVAGRLLAHHLQRGLAARWVRRPPSDGPVVDIEGRAKEPGGSGAGAGDRGLPGAERSDHPRR
jgi:UPF0716 protein FxsA